MPQKRAKTAQLLQRGEQKQYESVKDAAWSSDWVGAPVSYQRCILFIIAKASQEFQLTAWKFVPLSNTTMMSILNESLSIFMFLLTVKDQKKEIDNE
ncbi:hypothetical protein ANN_17303 [Periplaneta americana]|uniref:Uncharacterized protein n=1 Tax=Periplaneta americana TaxID=6978 RepID=A0ABQ8ST52_PERAM|nr:hypothetical protein ANN_17303 [Periplaneta americana]